MLRNFTKVFDKLIENCGNYSEQKFVRITVYSKDFIHAVYSDHTYNSPMYGFIHSNDSWKIFADALGSLYNLIISNCTVLGNNNTLANINGSALSLSSDDDNHAMDINTFIGGFVSGVAAISFAVTSYCLLKKSVSRIRSRGGGDTSRYASSYDDGDNKVKSQSHPNSMLNDSKETAVSSNQANLLLL